MFVRMLCSLNRCNGHYGLNSKILPFDIGPNSDLLHWKWKFHNIFRIFASKFWKYYYVTKRTLRLFVTFYKSFFMTQILTTMLVKYLNMFLVTLFNLKMCSAHYGLISKILIIDIGLNSDLLRRKWKFHHDFKITINI